MCDNKFQQSTEFQQSTDNKSESKCIICCKASCISIVIIFIIIISYNIYLAEITSI